MNKSDFILLLTERIKRLSQKEIETIVNFIFDRMTQSLARGDRIEIRGFGSFEVRCRRARKGRNPKTGEAVELHNRSVPFFKVGKELKEKVNHGVKQNKTQSSSSTPA